MKRTVFLTLLLGLMSLTQIQSQTTVTMGAAYANDVYFSIEDGIVETVDRLGWDLGFYTSPWSAGIITNGGAGVELKLYPLGDTTAWMSVDTNGMAGWPILYNGEDSWENGAFNRNSANHPDYGWGVYNSQNHDVVGDSIYVIKLQDGSYKKLWIVRKKSSLNTYIIRYSDLDNSNDMVQTLENNNFPGVNFSYFKFEDGSFFNREPASDSWDILFTRYQAMQPEGVPWPVIGVLNNVPTKAKRYHPVAMDYSDWGTEGMDSLKAVIGFNWKDFDMGSFSWAIEDSLIFYVSPANGNIYKMYFTDYVGTSTGEISFMTEKVSNLSLWESEANSMQLQLIPNPASSQVRLIWEQAFEASVSIHVYSITGREVLQQEIQSGSKQYTFDVSDLKAGMYLVSIVSGNQVANEKLVIE